MISKLAIYTLFLFSNFIYAECILTDQTSSLKFGEVSYNIGSGKLICGRLEQDSKAVKIWIKLESFSTYIKSNQGTVDLSKIKIKVNPLVADGVITLYKSYGVKDWEDPNIEKVAWPNANATVKLIDTKNVFNQKTLNIETFYFVEATYNRSMSSSPIIKKGWAHADSFKLIDENGLEIVTGSSFVKAKDCLIVNPEEDNAQIQVEINNKKTWLFSGDVFCYDNKKDDYYFAQAPNSAYSFKVKKSNLLLPFTQDKIVAKVNKSAGDITTVYSELGHKQWTEENSLKGVAWVNPDAYVRVDRSYMLYNKDDEKHPYDLFYLVYVKYRRNGIIVERQGYISSQYIDLIQTSNLKEEAEEAKASEEDSEENEIIKEYEKQGTDVGVNNLVGQCLSEPKKPTASYKVGYQTLNSMKQRSLRFETGFDLGFYDSWVNKDLNFEIEHPSVNRNLTKQEIADIDALARTIYSEMEMCHTEQAEYYKAVARVIYNRTQITNKSFQRLFWYRGVPAWSVVPEKYKTLVKEIKGVYAVSNPPLKSYKRMSSSSIEQIVLNVLSSPVIKQNELFSPLMQVISKPLQFSPWNTLSRYKGKKVINKNLNRALCPAKDRENYFYDNRKPHKFEVKAWDKAVSVAMEMVLDTEKFLKMTKSVNNILYFTSNVGSPPDSGYYRVIKPFISGAKVRRRRCLELWKPCIKGSSKSCIYYN